MSTKQVYVYRCDLCGKEKTTDKKLTALEERDILRTMQVPARTEGRFSLCIVQLCNECANRYIDMQNTFGSNMKYGMSTDFG